MAKCNQNSKLFALNIFSLVSLCIFSDNKVPVLLSLLLGASVGLVLLLISLVIHCQIKNWKLRRKLQAGKLTFTFIFDKAGILVPVFTLLFHLPCFV